jgi:hypothetical protein
MSLPVPDDADLLAALEWTIEKRGKRGWSFGTRPAEHLFEGGARFGRSMRATNRLKKLEQRGLVRGRRCERYQGWEWKLTPEGSALAQEGTLHCSGYWDQEACERVDCGAPGTVSLTESWPPKCPQCAAAMLRLDAAGHARTTEYHEQYAATARAAQARCEREADHLEAVG